MWAALLPAAPFASALSPSSSSSWDPLSSLRPIGHIDSVWRHKFATPRQGSVTPSARARLHLDGLDSSLDAAQSLEGLESYSHVWLVWLAHLNGHEATNSKVAAP